MKKLTSSAVLAMNLSTSCAACNSETGKGEENKPCGTWDCGKMQERYLALYQKVFLLFPAPVISKSKIGATACVTLRLKRPPQQKMIIPMW